MRLTVLKLKNPVHQIPSFFFFDTQERSFDFCLIRQHISLRIINEVLINAHLCGTQREQGKNTTVFMSRNWSSDLGIEHSS